MVAKLPEIVEALTRKGWVHVDGDDTQALVGDKFGPGCRVGALVDADGMVPFLMNRDHAPVLIEWDDVVTQEVPAPDAIVQMLFTLH